MVVFRTAYVYVRNNFAGKLCETDDGYSFAYNKQYLNQENASAVSLTIPLSEEIYISKTLFSFIVGNSDMHLKNFSLIETEENSGQYSLSPAYDLLPVNVIMPEDKEQFALAMNGKKRNIRRKDFLIFADACGISCSSVEKMIAMFVSRKEKFRDMCSESLLPEYLKERLISLIDERMRVFE